MERPEPNVLTLREAAARLGESERQVRTLAGRGLHPVATREGTSGRRWRWVRASDVAAFAAWDRVRTPGPPWLDGDEAEPITATTRKCRRD